MVSNGEKIISVRQFSDKCEIKPKYFDKPYYMIPLEGGQLAYTLLRQAFVESEKIALVTYIYFQKEHLGMTHVDDGMLMLQQLRFASEIVPRNDIKTPTLSQPTPIQVVTAVELMQRYTSPFYIEDYRNEHLERVTELLDRKMKGLGTKLHKTILTEITNEEAVLPAIQELLESESAKSLPRL